MERLVAWTSTCSKLELLGKGKRADSREGGRRTKEAGAIDRQQVQA